MELLQPPRCQRRLGTSRIILKSVHGLSGQTGVLSDCRDADRLAPEELLDLGKLLSRVGRLATEVGALAGILAPFAMACSIPAL
jgi:hypothetical protein